MRMVVYGYYELILDTSHLALAELQRQRISKELWYQEVEEEAGSHH